MPAPSATRTGPGRACAIPLLVGALGLGCLASTASAQTPSPSAEVEARELAFARTMTERDFDSFLSFISPEAVFFGPGGPLRGRDAVEEAWRPFFEGPEAPFSWRPDTVEVLESGRLALTSGPVLGPDGEPFGRFTTVWRLDADGVWRVVFDRGS